MIRINGKEIIRNRFPNGTYFGKIPYILINKHSFYEFEWYYEDDAELFELICLRKELGEKASLYIPYLPHARFDRVQNPDEVFTLKYFCEIINSLNFEKVIILDAHSNVSLALLNNVVNIQPTGYIYKTISDIDRGNLIYFFPDNGAAKRYTSVLNLHGDITYGIKDRDWCTGNILSLKIENPEVVKDKPVLIIDDICSKGGTFIHSAKALKEAGAKEIYLYVTHCENTIHKGEIFTSGLIEKVYTTDSLAATHTEKNKNLVFLNN